MLVMACSPRIAGAIRRPGLEWVTGLRGYEVAFAKRRNLVTPKPRNPASHLASRLPKTDHRLLDERARDAVGVKGPAEVEALRLIALAALQESELVLGFHTFGDHAQTQRPRDGDHSRDDRAVALIRGDAGDEGAVDLHRVERESLQVVERRVAGTEVVNRDRNADLTKRAEHLDAQLRVLHRGALRDLELQDARIDARVGDRAADEVRELVLLELSRRE